VRGRIDRLKNRNVHVRSRGVLSGRDGRSRRSTVVGVSVHRSRTSLKKIKVGPDLPILYILCQQPKITLPFSLPEAGNTPTAEARNS